MAVARALLNVSQRVRLVDTLLQLSLITLMPVKLFKRHVHHAVLGPRGTGLSKM